MNLNQTAAVITWQQRKRPKTRPGAVLGRPGDSEAQSRWVFKLARSSARCTPREGTKHEKPGGRWAAARRRAAAALGGGAPPPNGPPGGILIASRSCFPHGMQTRGTHYLSFSASGGLLLTPRSHKPAGKPTENPDPQNRKQYLGIHGTFSIARPSGKPESSMNSEVLLPILKVRIFAGFPGWLVTARHK